MQGHFSGQTPAHVVVLVFYCPWTPAFDTFPVISAWWVNLSTVFLGKPPKAVYQHLVHILSPVTLDCPSWISGREKMAVETSAQKSHQVQSCKHELAAHLSRLMIKPRNWPLFPAKTQISQSIRPVWSVFAVHMKKAWILSYPLRTQPRLWSDWADAGHTSFCRFCHAAAHLGMDHKPWVKGQWGNNVEIKTWAISPSLPCPIWAWLTKLMTDAKVFLLYSIVILSKANSLFQ